MINAKRALIIENNGNYKVKFIKPIKIISWHERNKQLINLELMCRQGKAVKLKEEGKIIKK